MIRFTAYGFIAEKPRDSHLPGFFSVHPVGKIYALDRKMNATLLMVSTSSVIVHSLGRSCLSVYFFLSVTLDPADCAFDGVHSSNDHYVAVYGIGNY